MMLMNGHGQTIQLTGWQSVKLWAIGKITLGLVCMVPMCLVWYLVAVGLSGCQQWGPLLTGFFCWVAAIGIDVLKGNVIAGIVATRK